jgi:hypothetical protein
VIDKFDVIFLVNFTGFTVATSASDGRFTSDFAFTRITFNRLALFFAGTFATFASHLAVGIDFPLFQSLNMSFGARLWSGPVRYPRHLKHPVQSTPPPVQQAFATSIMLWVAVAADIIFCFQLNSRQKHDVIFLFRANNTKLW